MIKNLGANLLNLLNKLITRKCVLCKYYHTDGYFCHKCNNLLLEATGKISNELGIFACYEYKFPYKHLVRNAKLQQDLPAYNAIALLMKQRIKQAVENNLFTLPEAFAFVPSYDSKRKVNHAEFLARKLGSYFDIPVIDSIKRAKPNKKQKNTSSRKERFENMKGAFMVEKREEFLSLNKLAIIDDIYTTGATISALKQEILRANPNLIVKTIVFSSHNNLLQNFKF